MSSRARLGFVWLALSAITLVSYWLGTQYDHGFAKTDSIAFLGVLGIAAIKARVIFRQFMDVRHAPLRLKLLTDAWLVATVAALVVAYFV